jgi:hypothetical protein
MKFTRLTLAVLLLAVAGHAQTVINGGRTILGPWDASGATSTQPVKVGTTDPTSCGVGEWFINTASTIAIKVCSATDTWSVFLTALSPVGSFPIASRTQTKCVDFGSDNAASDLVDADLGPQGRIWMLPVAATVIEATVAANAGTPKMPILQKNHAGTATDFTSAALATASAGGVACAATGSACLDGTAKDGTVTIVTAGSANVLAAGDWIQTKTGSGFASSGAKRVSVCVTYAVN